MGNNKGKYVTRRECEAAMTRGTADFAIIKRALVGNDMRGGLVKDVADLKSKVDGILKNNCEKNEISMKWKLAIFGAMISLIVNSVSIALRFAGV